MFTVDVLPACYGDSLWVEYGDARSPWRFLVDGGPFPTFEILKRRIEKLPPEQRHFELMVVSHIDTDHIEGVLKLLTSPSLGVSYGDIWHNAWDQLVEEDRMGAKQGEHVSAVIHRDRLPLNLPFHGKAVVVPATGTLPQIELPGGMKLTLLSPDREALVKLRDSWDDVLADMGMSPGDEKTALETLAEDRRYADLLGTVKPNVEALSETKFTEDDSENNGSSISFLAEYGDESVLFGGDAHPSVLENSIKRLLKERSKDKLSLSAFKMPHHGSKNNISVSLLKLLSCHSYIFSTNGTKFRHPDREAVARVIRYGGDDLSILFNYRSALNSIWEDEELQSAYGFRCRYPAPGKEGITLNLQA
jgi:hypothetical protein